MLILLKGEVEVSFLHPHGPAKSFRYPAVPDILIMNIKDILTAVSPSTSTGRTYTLTGDGSSAAISALITRVNYRHK
jgi:hypothetical protein